MNSSLYDYSISSNSSSSIPPRHHSNNNKKGRGNLGSLRGSAFSAYSRPNYQTTRDAHSYRNAAPAPKPIQTKSTRFENTASVDTTMATLSNLDLTGSAAWDKSPVSVARTTLTTTTTWSSHPNNHVGSVTHINPTASAALAMPILVTSPLFQPNGSPWTPMAPNTAASSSLGTTTRQAQSSHAMSLHDAMEASPIDSCFDGTRAMISSTEDAVLMMKPVSPTESATSDSSGCGSSVVDDDDDQEMDTTNLLVQAPATATATTTTTTPSQFAPAQRPDTTARIVPHAFVSLPPEETSDPEEQARRKQARAREQQELILERVRTARQERKVHQQAKSPRQKNRRKHKSCKADKSVPNVAQVNSNYPQGRPLTGSFERSDKANVKKKQRKSRQKKATTVGGKLTTTTTASSTCADD